MGTGIYRCSVMSAHGLRNGTIGGEWKFLFHYGREERGRDGIIENTMTYAEQNSRQVGMTAPC